MLTDDEFGGVEGERCFMEENDQRITRIKVYPLLTHALKKLTKVNMSNMPTSGAALWRRLTGLRGLLGQLRAQEDKLGGYRMEATFTGRWSEWHQAASVVCTPEGLAR